MRIAAAAQRLGTSPRMLRYRELLGLLPPVREAGPGQRSASRTGHGPAHRQFGADDLAAVAFGLDIERRLDISPAALAFGLRVLAEPGVRAQVAELGRRIGRIPAPPGRALEFEKERALRLLSMGSGRRAAAPRAGGRSQAGPARSAAWRTEGGAQHPTSGAGGGARPGWPDP
jgi:MerR family transcriptional regulator, copper efflux regulator